MKEKDRLYEELQKQAPFLKPLQEGDKGLRVPENYFDNLEADVFRQLDAIGAKRQPITPQPRPSLWQWLQSLWQPRIALALAGVFALLLAAWWYYRPQTDLYYTPELAAIPLTADDAEAYLLDNLMELDPEQIAVVLPREGLTGITLNPEPNPSGTQSAPSTPVEITPDDINDLLRDMTDEELENLLL